MSFRHAFLLMLCLLLLLTQPLSCTPRKYTPKLEAPEQADQMPLPRADPAYLQYLERMSMLAQSREMAKVVSGSELAWRSAGGSPEGLLGYADNWLLIHPLTLLGTSRGAAFGQLTSASTWPVMREAGLKGLYVSPMQGGGAIWAKAGKEQDTGDDVVQYGFSRQAGEDAQYKRLMSGVIENNALLGSDLVPGATGLGPDFFLASSNVREYPGVYCMVEIPEKLWSHLPATPSEWEGVPLSSSQVQALHAEGLLPKALRDDVLSFGRPGGWAATGTVRGVDGNNYRWVYRYHKTPRYAVLNWEDPSQTAHRILSGSAVRQVGLQGQALLGLRFEAFQGLEAAAEGHSDSFSIEPARTAASSMSREVRRYGGWSWLRDDNLALHSLRDVLSSGTPFVQDGVFSPAAEHALLTGDASLIRFMADEAMRLGIDARRLVHGMPNQDGINYSLPHLAYLSKGSGGQKAADFRSAIQGGMRSAASKAALSPVSGQYLYVTGPGLAALALGAVTEESAKGKVRDIEKGHSLLIFFKAMQPGALMLAGQDLAGVLPQQWGGIAARDKSFKAENSSRGAYALNAAAAGMSVSAYGVPRSPSLYDSPDLQVHASGSFLKRIGTFLRARTEHGISRGTLVARPETKNKGSVALLTRLAGKGHLLSVCNFSRNSVTETISLAGRQVSLSGIRAIATGGEHSVSGSSVTVTLGPWEGRALLFGGGSGALEGPAEQIPPIPSVPQAPAQAADKQESPAAQNATPAQPPASELSAPSAAVPVAPAAAKAPEEVKATAAPAPKKRNLMKHATDN